MEALRCLRFCIFLCPISGGRGILRRKADSAVDNVVPHEAFRKEAEACYFLCACHNQHGSQHPGHKGRRQYDMPGRKPETFRVYGCLDAEKAVKQNQNA